MADIKKWFIAEPTKKIVYEGIYPCVITAAKVWEKEVEKDDKTFTREIVTLTFKTLSEVPFPDKTNDKILVEQNYYFDVQMHQNALNGIARACGIGQLSNTDQFEGKTCMIGITNREYQKDGETKYIPQLGYGLFSYAPMVDGAKVEYIGNTYPNPTDDDRKEWYKETLSKYKQPR